MTASAARSPIDILTLAGAKGVYAKTLAAALDARLATTADALTIRDLTPDGDAHARLTLLLLFAALNEGALRLPATAPAFAAGLRRLGLHEDEAEDFAPPMLAWLNEESTLVTRIKDGTASDVLETPLVLRHLDNEAPRLYFQRYFHYESKLESHLGERLARPISIPGEKELADLHGMLSEIQPAHLAAEQKLAVAVGVLSPFLILSGGPGTGKTTTILTLLRALLRRGVDPARLLLAAPTGRAAYRLTESIHAALARGDVADPDMPLLTLSASTIHRALRYQPRRDRFGYHAGHPLPADVIVVDEVSMVDAVLMARFLDAVTPATKLILVGDRRQLPSVDAGAVLGDLVPDGIEPAFSAEMRRALGRLGLDVPESEAGSVFRDRFVLLRTSHRARGALADFASETDPEKLATAILEAPTIAFDADTDDGWPIPEPGGAAISRIVPASSDPATYRACRDAALRAWARRHYLDDGDASSYRHRLAACDRRPHDWYFLEEGQAALRNLLDALSRARILTLLRRGPYGCGEANALLIRGLRKPLGGTPHGECFGGLPVLVTANDYRQDVFNGDVGVLVRPRAMGWHVALDRPGAVRLLPLESVPAWEPAFATTVHKSQGSEYDAVLLLLPPHGTAAAEPLLSREIVYTAVTRARRDCTILGEDAVISAATARAAKPPNR